jgi:predicted peptidase
MREDGRLEVRRLRRDVRAELEYLVHIPTGSPPAEGHPLVLFLHGRGERETLDHVASFGPPAIARETPDFPWAVVAPRCPPERGWETGELLAVLDEAEETMPVDRSRVVLTGLSMGGYGCWALVMTAPERFAAVVPICGGAPVAMPRLLPPSRIDALRRVPIRAFHGADDPVVAVDDSAWIVGELRALGCDVQFTVYPGVGHDSWTRTYADPALWAWLERVRRYDSR